MAGVGENVPYQRLASGTETETPKRSFFSDIFTTFKKRPEGRWIPEETASFWSRITFLWVSSIISIGNHKTLEADDLWDISEEINSKTVVSILQTQWEKQRNGPKPSLGMALWSSFGFQFALAGILKLAQDSLQFMSPLFLKWLVEFVQNKNRTTYHGIVLALSLLGCNVLQSICLQNYFHVVFKTVVKVRAALISLVYQKSLKISSVAKQSTSLGEIVNLQSNDAQKLADLCIYLHLTWSAPLQIFGSLGLLFSVIGVLPALSGVLAMVVLIPLGSYLMNLSSAIRQRLLTCTDKRVKAVGEILGGIRAVKLYAWERAVKSRLGKLREDEISQIRATVMLDALMYLLYYLAPSAVSLVSLGCFVFIGQTLTPSVAFTSLALFNLLRFPLFMIPAQINSFAQALVSFGRLENFLGLPETAHLKAKENSSVGSVELQNATFCWKDPEPSNVEAGNEGEEGKSRIFFLSDINLVLPPGKLLMIIGKVGAGKSSFLGALSGEMKMTAGKAYLNGSLAYTAQDPWIQNATLRDNILMGRPFDQEKYERIIEACALKQDLASLPQGDRAEIGERGLTLSGGQKHRVAMARALYSEAEIVLLDDPLSAVDPHVGRHLFDKCIMAELAGKTRILVTHQLQYAESADIIAVISEGRVEAVGTFKELVEKGVDFHLFKGEEGEVDTSPEEGKPAAELNQKLTVGQIEEETTEGKTSVKKEEKLEEGKGESGGGGGEASLIQEEMRAKGKVKGSVYLAYFKSWSSGGYLMPILVLSGFVLAQAARLANDAWLAVWSGDMEKGEHTVSYYLGVFAALALLSGLLSYLRSVLMVQSSLSASRNLHKQLTERVLRLPMSFFDSQPMGRLLNRFTRDTEQIDIQLPDSVSSYLICLLQVLFALGIIVYVTPPFAVPVVPVLWLYKSIQERYIAASRELKRLDSVARSPVFAYFGETVQGLATIRAFSRQDEFSMQSHSRVDASTRAYFASTAANRWLAMRLEVLGALAVFSTAVLCVTNGSVSPGFAGLALTNALTITTYMNWMVRMNAELETQMNSVERVLEYSALPTEAPEVIETNRPPKSWPEKGAIDAHSIVVRYRPDLDPVLKGLSFSILGGEKVGICGRTGCGKSTLVLTLYRMIELEQGRIFLDNIDISKIGLWDLRSRLALVPQDPVVFSGTIRSNLDPFEESNGDSELWVALEKAGLKSVVERLSGGLDGVISEGGSNLSTGQRQLLCMARALLRKTSVLILDEATSNVDGGTDALIQKTIRESFKDFTVLTIAHRLHTIIDSDRVMLLEKGELVEFDSPQGLLSDKGSKFSGFVDQSLPREANSLRKVASRQKMSSGSNLAGN